jgi:ornithine--oxo-acid transaminase
VLSNRDLMLLFRAGEHGSTFGGNPLGSAVAIAALDVIVDENLPSRARYAGAKIMQGLRTFTSPLIKEVRGRGLLIGVELTVPARRLSEALLVRGIAAKDTHENVLRIAPPLVIGDAEIDLLLREFGDALASI